MTTQTASPPGISAIHFEMLTKRGLTHETIAAAKLKSVIAEQIKSIVGFNPPFYITILNCEGWEKRVSFFP